MPDQNKNSSLPQAETGNAVNPPPENPAAANQSSQLLSKKAEKYIRESGKIEDLPDTQEQKEIDEVIKKERQA